LTNVYPNNKNNKKKKNKVKSKPLELRSRVKMTFSKKSKFCTNLI
jgi:flagellar basal body-associated protein FliL